MNNSRLQLIFGCETLYLLATVVEDNFKVILRNIISTKNFLDRIDLIICLV